MSVANFVKAVTELDQLVRSLADNPGNGEVRGRIAAIRVEWARVATSQKYGPVGHMNCLAPRNVI